MTLLLSDSGSSSTDWEAWNHLDFATQNDVLEVYERNPFRKKRNSRQVFLLGDSYNKTVNANQCWPLENVGRIMEGSGSFSAEVESSDTGESIPPRSRVPTYYTRDSPFELDWIRSSVRKSTLRRLRNKYDVPSSVTMRLPNRGEKASQPRDGEVAIFEVLLELGLRLPLQSYFVMMLSKLNLAPCQLILNSWRSLVGMYVLWQKIGCGEPSFLDFCRLYQVRAGPKTNPGFYYFASRSKTERPIPDFPESNKSWKDRWFFVGGEWGQEMRIGDVEYSVPASFSTKVFKAGKPILDQDSEDRIQEILAESYIPRDLFSDYSLKATSLISFIPEITKKGMAPKREKKKKDGRAAMNQLAEFIAGSTPDIGSIDIPNPPELAMFNVSQSLPMEAKDRVKKDLTTGVVPTDKRKRRKLGMSVEASSSSPIHVMDITAVKRDRYEHLIPVVKSMERSVNREWADLELRAEDTEILALCSEMSHKLNFLLSECRDKVAQKLKDAQKTSSLERECESYKKEVKRLETRVAELLNEKISVQLASEKRDLYLAEVIGEKDKLTPRVTELDLELLATVQAKGQAEGNAYVKGVSDIVGMFRKKFPLENLDFLDKALQVARDSLESGSEDEEGNTDCEKENDYEGMISDGVGKEDADENDKVTGGDPENHEKISYMAIRIDSYFSVSFPDFSGF